MDLAHLLDQLPSAADAERAGTLLGIAFLAFRSAVNSSRISRANQLLTSTEKDVQKIAITIDGRMDELLRVARESAALAAAHGEAVGIIAGRKAERSDVSQELAIARAGVPLAVKLTEIAPEVAEVLRAPPAAP